MKNLIKKIIMPVGGAVTMAMFYVNSAFATGGEFFREGTAPGAVCEILIYRGTLDVLFS